MQTSDVQCERDSNHRVAEKPRPCRLTTTCSSISNGSEKPDTRQSGGESDGMSASVKQWSNRC